MYPRTIFADQNGPWRQLGHLISEVWEVVKALLARDYHHAAEELVDVQHSAETFLEIIRDRYGVDTIHARETVITRNRSRGYYRNWW